MFKFLDPTGCTYHNGEVFQYNLPQQGAKWGAPTMHPNPVIPDGSPCGPGRLHLMKGLNARGAPDNWWPWWAEPIGDLIGEDEEKAAYAGCRLCRISPSVFAQYLRQGWGRGHVLNRAVLSWANLHRANLNEAHLYEANLYRANLSNASLIEAHLYYANLSEANLSGANLSGANLRMADLTGANLSEANLQGANLNQSHLNGANLQDAIC